MKGSIFALLAGTFITLQGVAVSQISKDIGTWQAATITQFIGFIVSLTIVLTLKDQTWKKLKEIKPLYLSAGSFGAIVLFSNVLAFQKIGATLTMAVLLIAQLGLTFIIDSNGWFEVKKQKMELPQVLGIAMMVTGVVILTL
jgi:bacterial/archaeal transporter family-2 protein